MSDVENEIKEFVEGWKSDLGGCRSFFLELYDFLGSLELAEVEFQARPGVTYSLRAKHQNQTGRPLFVMADVIEAEPRWLSVCFFGDDITDPEERGDFVPGGLLGEDGHCFDVEEASDENKAYVLARIKEAYKAAG